ncbi:MAG: hypothetical protein ACQESR_00365 [Planctomycetota bacterium]
MAEDPLESHDRAAAQPGKVAQLWARLRDYADRGASRPGALAIPAPFDQVFAQKTGRNAMIEALTTGPATPVPFRDAPAAALDAGGRAVDTFRRGVKLFADRDYALLEPPPELADKTFFRAPIGGASFRCAREGLAWVVTPSAGRNPDSLEAELLADGFEKTDLEACPLFNRRPGNLCSVFQKGMKEGEELSTGKWGVVIAAPSESN